ncbi:twin-arginine translocation signal domain-containing protein [Cellulophaga sp. Hel_I_12]|uniref:twin-arginine translocation signal domain-containing protein n=1 Tax=Cellulophaga sp. Hel_I_12 TaxID=1249972 RepID=UPI000AC1073C|nr:twin-arginine translocation signal domain-containing protein [Cellulophaga sp. Hel_I_12]
MKKNNKTESVKSNRRDFIANVSLAAAALTLNSAFGFPAETEQGNGKLFWKLESPNSSSEGKNGIFRFSDANLEKLKSGKMESLTLKIGISADQRRWTYIESSITDKNFMKQLTEIARKS